MNPHASVSGDDPAAHRRSLADGVVDRLRTAIVRGAFAPDQHLSEAALAQSFGVSRGPIREAFAHLEREGLLKIERHRGARVTALSTTDIDEIFELRLTLETLAARRACQHASEADHAALGAALGVLGHAVQCADLLGAVAADVALHDCIYVAAKHERLYAAWSVLRPQIEAFLVSRARDQHDYLERAVAEHGLLCTSICERDESRAVALLEAHIRNGYERLVRLPFDR